jgi:acyl-CoA dehydrogenase
MNTETRPSRTEQGRGDLAAWLSNQPENFYLADPLLHRVLARLGGTEFLERMDGSLERFGAVCAGPLDEAAAINNRPWNLPRLERYDAIGNRTEQIENHPSYHVAGRHIYESGMIAELGEPGGFLRAMALFYLSSHCGEAGHNCPVACTAGIVKSLQGVGTPELRRRFLPRLLSRSYAERFDGAQFLTEVQGGSDVGANATRARPLGDGCWAIEGEKWFCSNANADLILMTARYDDDVTGTPGLGLFLVPRVLDDGTANHFVIRRLKDKLGTRSMPSGEIDFEGAVAWPLGPVQDGFKSMMRFVINTSRLYNALATTGAARRALHVAAGYAAHRRAFGQPIGEFPTTAKLVADIRAESTAAAIASLDLAARFDSIEAGATTRSEDAFLRLFVNANKLRTSRSATECVMLAIETLGGNGAIESFSILPRLLRDMIVCENWEGTHNTLAAQMYRDMVKLRCHEGFFDHLRERIGAQPDLYEAEHLRNVIVIALDRLSDETDDILEMEPAAASLRVRPLVERLSWIAWAVSLFEQAQYELSEFSDPTTLHVAEYWWNLRLSSYGVLEFDELKRIRELAAP